MKRIILMLVVLISTTFAQAQNYAILHVEEVPATPPNVFSYCYDEYAGVVIYAQQGCHYNEWIVDYTNHYQNLDSIVIEASEEEIYVHYSGCGLNRIMTISFLPSEIDNPFSEPLVWKRQGESITLFAESYGYSITWSTGETTNEIQVTEPGVYSVTIEDTEFAGCVNQTFYVEVRDNVELYRATCDLRSNLNQVTWQTTPAQAEYISQVKVYRNTYQLVATVPYLDGSFTDDIGSESTQWQYHIVGVDTNGNDCPIPSYWKRTIHLDHVQGTGGGEILQWTPYQDEQESNSVLAYNIYDVVDGEPNLVMQVGNFTNVYAYNPNDFDGYGTVAAVFQAKGNSPTRDGFEDLAFSNLTADILDVGEQSLGRFTIYPNPSNGTFTVEGAKTLTIYNIMGQVVARSDNNEGKHSLSLAPGVYFIKCDEGSVQKVVVE